MKKAVMFILLFTFAGFIFCAVSGNWGCVPLNPDGCENSTGDSILSTTSDNSLGYYIMVGASYFFQSYSDFQMVMNEIELSERYGVDTYRIKKKIDSALLNMIMANDAYFNLYESSLEYPNKKKEYETRLKKFDYVKFGEKHNVIPSIYSEVQQYLSECDIHAIFLNMLEKSSEVMKILQVLSVETKMGTNPKLEIIWECNQLFIKSELFGQYVSMIMNAIIER